jgi:hypothetical protein
MFCFMQGASFLLSVGRLISVVGCQQCEGHTLEVLEVLFLAAPFLVCASFLSTFSSTSLRMFIYCSQGVPCLNWTSLETTASSGPPVALHHCHNLFPSSYLHLSQTNTDMLSQPSVFDYRGATDLIGTQERPTQNRTNRYLDCESLAAYITLIQYADDFNHIRNSQVITTAWAAIQFRQFAQNINPNTFSISYPTTTHDNTMN